MTAERIRGYAWPIGVVAALGFMIASSLLLLVIAAAHPDPLVVDDEWRAEDALHETLRAERIAHQQGLQLLLHGEQRPGGVQLDASLVAAGGEPSSGAHVVVTRERPAEDGLDARFELAPHASRFDGWIPLPRPGRWRLRVRAELGAAALERVLVLSSHP
jgi:nitrogen fixation protein FixH